ncbi:MAG: anaerobic ribonucleoside-triphosphate reductase activating protein [Lachnospiraceae bacterium]|nr:anaerobic ribonucleoside-triphosphate reductase activating protein [Lachnospiraceae bacterium]
MKIYGLQKMTLLDYPGRVACTVFTGGCDFRCPFCHNFELADGSADPVMEEEELFAFLEKRKGLLDGVAFTGGEPCLQKELAGVMRKVKKMGFLVKLDTNGCHPGTLCDILSERLADYVAMDIKNSPAKYAKTAGVSTIDIDVITQSIRLIMEKAPDYEFRTTVVDSLHEEADFIAIGEWIRGAKRYFLQGFIDRDSVPEKGLKAPSIDALHQYIEAVRPYVGAADLRGIEE